VAPGPGLDEETHQDAQPGSEATTAR